jgi:tRNA1Val (adenine37-N6)-methyltransferase
MSVFHFKQFSVNQSGCAMKVNTDGVLLGALAAHANPQQVLDVGTGTGVIALMLAQRFAQVRIDAVEIDGDAAQTARNNFASSAYHSRLQLYSQSFQSLFNEQPEKRYDLIVSNPPFYINALASPGAAKAQAKHASHHFFEQLIAGCAAQIRENGQLWLILPVDTAALVKQIAQGQWLNLVKIIFIQSFVHSQPHREILVFSPAQTETIYQRLVIYNEAKVYSKDYQELLKAFLTIF